MLTMYQTYIPVMYMTSCEHACLLPTSIEVGSMFAISVHMCTHGNVSRQFVSVTHRMFDSPQFLSWKVVHV